MAPQKKKEERVLDLKKGQLLVVKAPPYYEKEYLYEITSAGEKLVRASLLKSPTVRKSWERDKLALLFDMEIVRSASEQDVQQLSGERESLSDVDQGPE